MAATQKGQTIVLVTIYFIIIASVVIGTSALLGSSQLHNARDIITSKRGYVTAESGAEDMAFRIMNGKIVDPAEGLALNGGTVSTTWTQNGSKKDIAASSVIANKFRRTFLTLQGSYGANFSYGAQIGEGGVIMGANSQIQGFPSTVPGNLYSNGPVTGANGAVVTGNVVVATAITPDVSITNPTEDQQVGETAPHVDFMQSFTPSANGNLAKVSLYIKKVGQPSDVTVRITNNDGTQLLGQGVLLSSLVGAEYAWIDVVLDAPLPNLTGGSIYWIVFDTILDSNKYYIWSKGSELYAGGSAQYAPDWSVGLSGWTFLADCVGSTPCDFGFKTFQSMPGNSTKDIIVYLDALANTIDVGTKACGDAYYTTIDAGALTFLNAPGVPCPTPYTNGIPHPGSPDPPLASWPISDAMINQWKSDALAGGSVGAQTINGTTVSLGPVKIEGDLVTTTNGDSVLVVTGVVHVTGNAVFGNGSTIRCDASFGQNSCMIIVDGWVDVSNGANFAGSGQSGSYMLIVDTLAGCLDATSPSPPCYSNGSAINIGNVATGALFYSQKSFVNIHNNANVTQVTAYKLNLNNNALVTYEQSLVNTQFSPGPGGGWLIRNWHETKQ